AHEIKNPLNSIGLIVDLMGDRYAPRSEADRIQIKKLSDDLKGELARLNQIVEGFIGFARPMEVCLKSTDLGELLKETIDFIQPEARVQNVRLHLSINRDLPKILADYGQLRHAIMNLLINAIQAMPDGGDIHVRAYKGPAGIKIAVQDSGCGIPR